MPSTAAVDPLSGYCAVTRPFHSLRAPIPLPPPSLAVSFPAFGVRLRPSGVYYAEIRSGDTRLGLGTFETTRAYDATAWRLRRPQAQMNFSHTQTREHAQELAPPLQLITDKDRRVQRR